VQPAFTADGQDLLRHVNHVKNDNIDHWFNDHPAVFQELVKQYQNSAHTVAFQEPPANSAPGQPALTIIYESRPDCLAKHNINNKAHAITQLLLARKSTNADGDPILVPGIISSSFKDALQEPLNHAFRLLAQQYHALIATKSEEDSLNMINNHMNRFPHIIITPAFAAAALNGHWANQPLQQEVAMIGQSLSIFTFTPVRTGTAEYKRQFKESNAILGEDLVGTANSHQSEHTAVQHVQLGGNVYQN
jgi:hypothetical protein